jgi:hypothetical protein
MLWVRGSGEEVAQQLVGRVEGKVEVLNDEGADAKRFEGT